MTLVVFLGVFTTAIALAWLLAARRPEHRPVALLLSAALFADAFQLAWEVEILAPLRATLGVQVAWTGWAFAAAVVATAIELAAPAALLAAALVVFLGRRPWAAALAWGSALAFFVGVHPIAGDGSQARALAVVHAASAVASAGMAVAWYRRRSGPANSAQLAVALLVTTELVSLFGAWRAGPFEHWPVSQVLYLTMLGALVVAQGRCLWISRSASI